MNPRFRRKALLLSLFIFAIIGVISVFTSLTSKATKAERDEGVVAPDVDIPFGEEPTERVELSSLADWNTVMCWPSIGGIIVNRHVSSVELDFLNLSRFEASPRSYNANKEDAFCRLLRQTGGKWWSSYWDFMEAVDTKMRPMSAKEREALLLGWPEDGGVFVMREDNWYDFGKEPGSRRLSNAYTMEERCKAMEMSGAVYYAKPEDYELVKALLDGFGEHEREPEENYHYNLPADWYSRF